jgi:hypothetical protein
LPPKLLSSRSKIFIFAVVVFLPIPVTDSTNELDIGLVQKDVFTDVKPFCAAAQVALSN